MTGQQLLESGFQSAATAHAWAFVPRPIARAPRMRGHLRLRPRVPIENRANALPAALARRPHATRPERLFLEGVQTLAHALEAKDAYTWGHSARVSVYATAIARELGLSEHEIAEIALGGELHDVGKIGVPENLLHKTGPLSPEEYRQVMEHTVIGTRILYPLLHGHPTVLNIVRSHHERMDGKGLPDSLPGEAIPLEARIVAVADAFDAMTSPRPYRSARPVFAALRDLEEGVGSQFDRDCVRAFVAAVGAMALAPTERRSLAS